MNILISDYPRLSLPSLDAVTNQPIRDAVDNYVTTVRTVQAGHQVAGRIEAGHQVNELSPEQIADAIRASRAAGQLVDDAKAQYRETLGEHRAQWREDAAARATKTRAALLKTATAALSAIAAYELEAGAAAMANADGPELVWKAPAETFELGEAARTVRALVDRIGGQS